MGKPHVLVVPFPAQGHVLPLMEFSNRLVDCGINVTLVTTEFHHARMMEALPVSSGCDNGVRLVSIPDGMGADEDRGLTKICDAVYNVMPRHFEDLMKKIRESDGDKLSFVIADRIMTSVLVVAEKLGIRRAVFSAASMANFALNLHIPKMIEEEIIDSNGMPSKHKTIRLAPTMPEVEVAHFTWNAMKENSQFYFKFVLKVNESLKLAQWLLCNSFYGLEPTAFDLVPHALPIGPLLSDHRTDKPVGHFWPEDSSSLMWLDQQLPGSVIYVAFGSFTILNQRQFHELAHGLELTGRPFIWVVRPDLMDGSSAAYPDGFEARVAQRGKMVGWAPQQKVLAHPSVGCFMSHCGWNSTTEGLSNGVPFLCWPYFADQFLNQGYICDVWKIGFKFNPNEDGIVTKEDIRVKIDALFGDDGIKARVLELKNMAEKHVREGGTSWKNFNDFVEAIYQN